MARCVKKLGLVLTTVLVCLLGLTLPAGSVAADITQPEEFYGDIIINGVAAPVGTVVIAKISGVERGTFTTTEAGKYGGSGTFDPRLIVSGEESDTGKTITFWVNGSQADQTAIYEPGESKELNLTAWAYPLGAGDIQITRALNYLSQAQQPNGSIGGFSVSGWVVMALAAASEDPDSWNAGGDSIVDYLRDNAGVNLDVNKATDWERSILAIVAAGKNPRSFGGVNYVDTLLAFYDGSQIGDNTLLNDDFWGILALAGIGESQTVVQASRNFIISNQNSDGGWGLAVGGNSDADNTAAAVSALIAAGVSPSSQTITDALSYLKSQQQNDGGFVSEGTTNSAVDAWVINAITDVEQNPVGDEWKESGRNPIEHLLSLQDTDGAFKWTAAQRSNPEWMTAYAVLALMGKSWPKDTTPPTISNLTPSSGTSVSTTSPTINASYSDAVSGIDTATATISVDGTNRTSSATATASGISYAASGLTVGTHLVTVTVSDKAGNEASQSWFFQVVAGGTGGGGGALPPGTTSVSDIVTGNGIFIYGTTARSEDGKCLLNINAGTRGLKSNGRPLTQITIVEEKDPPDPPEDSNIVGLAYDLGPDGATFDPSITLKYIYDPDDIPAGITEEDLVIAYYDEDSNEWVELDSVVDPKTNTITTEISHFTAFSILAHTRPAAFTVSDLLITPIEIDIGESMSIRVLVTNTGDLEGAYEVSLKIDNVQIASKEVTLIGGASKTVTFTTSKNTPGTYTISVDGLSGSFTVKAVPQVIPQVSSEPPVVPPAVPELKEAPEAAAAPPPPASPVEPRLKWPLIGGIIAGVIVVGLLVFFLSRRAYYY